MKYELHKLINGSLVISDNIVLTNENPSITIDEDMVNDVESFDIYLKDNPFCKVLKVAEEVKSFKKVK